MTDETQPDAPVVEQAPAPDPVAETPEVVYAPRPVTVDNHTRRSGDDALFGHWVDIVGGEFAGRRGHYFQDLSNGPDGFPDQVLVRSRDSRNEVLTVNYSDVRPTEYSGGR